MTGPQISVVVPFYNNEDLLADCLRSIAAQTVTSLEVIMVDDGSTDGSAKIAQRQADDDPRFFLVSVTNGGPGYARNRGIEKATGEFLAFVDADDMLPSHALEIMLHTLQTSGSDFVSGGVERIGPAGITLSGMHSRAIKTRRIGTHISVSPELFWDVSVWNKLFRRSFWDSAGMSFPEVMALGGPPGHDPRSRAGQGRGRDPGPDLLLARARQGRAVDHPVADRASATSGTGSPRCSRSTRSCASADRARLLREHQRKALVNDLWLYVGDLSRTSDEYQAEFIVLGGKYLARSTGA